MTKWNGFCIMMMKHNFCTMKKTILLGVMAMFAIGAMSIQTANAQNAEVKVKKVEAAKVTTKTETPSTTTVAQEPVKKTNDCCADKKVSADKKENAECCDAKKAECAKKVAADKRVRTDRKAKSDRKALKVDGKKMRKHDAVKERKQMKNAPAERVATEQ